MIDEKKIYNYIKEQINPYGKPFTGTVYEFGLKIMDYIENMEKVGWIPCSERMPELHRVDMESEGEYYMISDSVIITDGERVSISEYEIDDGDCQGWLAHDFEEIEDVIAWMPIPEPYRQGEEE